jgi:hypothetical protein
MPQRTMGHHGRRRFSRPAIGSVTHSARCAPDPRYWHTRQLWRVRLS